MLIEIPANVQKAAQKGLNLRSAYGRGGTAVGLATGRLLAKGEPISLNKVIHISKYFPRHAGDNLHQTNPPSNGYIAWLLWGGDGGWRWADRWKRAVDER
jgi:hypothetical protein